MRFLRFSIIAIIMTLGFATRFAQAQESTETTGELVGACEVSNAATNSLECEIKVPAGIIGASMDIAFPKGPITQVRNLRQGETLPVSSLFFKLDIEDQGQQFLMEVDFAEMTAQPFSNEAYVLVSFEVVVSDLTAPGLSIAGVVEIGSELFDLSSFDKDAAAFQTNTDLPLPFTLGALPVAEPEPEPEPTPEPTAVTEPEPEPEPEPTTPQQIGSTFTPLEQPEPTTTPPEDLRGAAPVEVETSSYCFDDAKISLQEAEWEIICEAKERGFISGNPRDGGYVFLPHNTINRAEAMKILTLGILKTLGTLRQSDFTAMENFINSLAGESSIIGYPDITFDASGIAPWFALYIQLASNEGIASGYPNGTFQPANTIINAETYKVVVETAALASNQVAAALGEATRDTANQAWFMKYAQVLREFDIDYSSDFEAPTKRKDFMILVMELLNKVGV